MDYLRDKPIAVLGGGDTARGHAACAALGGREVRLYELPQFFNDLGCIKEKREIRLGGIQESLYGYKREGLATLDVVTDDMEKAVKNSGIIIVAFPSIGYKAFFEKLIPHLEDGMVIHFTTANFGSLILRKMMREAGCTKKVVIGEWSSQPYGIRNRIRGGVKMPEMNINYWAISLRGAALPMIDMDAFFESKQYVPSLDSVVHPVRGDTVADIGFSNINPILHCPGTLLGVGIQEFAEDLFFSRSNILGPEHMGDDYVVPFNEQYTLALGTGPFSIDNRYITEDVPVGCHIFRELARKFGIHVPVIESMITLGSVMTGIDFWETGVTLRDLGIDHMDKQELNAYLREGVYAA